MAVFPLPTALVRLPTALGLAAAILSVAAPVQAADDDAAGDPSQEEIEAWLDARAVTDTRDTGSSVDDAPPPPPAYRGIVIEMTTGALGHIGTMSEVSPGGPWIRLASGYEVWDWFMPFAEGDIFFSDTHFANPPPEPRAYVGFGFGAGLRFTIRPADRFGMYLQASGGFARVKQDALRVYGFPDSDQLNLYYGGMLGFEWYMKNPHYAIAATGGVRNFGATFERVRSTEPALGWMGGLSLRYAFATR